jgi:hypothetical protein
MVYPSHTLLASCLFSPPPVVIAFTHTNFNPIFDRQDSITPMNSDLLRAARFGNLPRVQWLLRAGGASISETDIFGSTALLFAAAGALVWCVCGGVGVGVCVCVCVRMFLCVVFVRVRDVRVCTSMHLCVVSCDAGFVCLNVRMLLFSYTYGLYHGNTLNEPTIPFTTQTESSKWSNGC